MTFKSSAILAGALLGLGLTMAAPVSATPLSAALGQSIAQDQARDDSQIIQVQRRRGGGAVVNRGGGNRGGFTRGGGGNRGFAGGGGRGRGGRGGGWGGGGAGAAAAAGILGGVLGAIAADQAAQEPYYAPAPVYGAPAYGGGGDEAYCMRRFRSYDPRSGTYVGFDGQRYSCP